MTGNESDDDQVGFYKGNKLRLFTTKNRIVKPMYSAQVFIDFSAGMSKYDGLIEEAVKFGYLEDVRGGWVCKSYSDKRVTYKDLITKDEIWNTFIDDFNKKSIEKMAYSNINSRELDKIEKAIDEKDDIID